MLAGIKLKEMEMSDMLDVLHYLLDDDMTYASSEQMDAKISLRKSIYTDFYKKPYIYAFDSDERASFDFDDDEAMPVPFNVNEIKPYIPPTNFDADAANPFQGTLREAPLG